MYEKLQAFNSHVSINSIVILHKPTNLPLAHLAQLWSLPTHTHLIHRIVPKHRMSDTTNVTSQISTLYQQSEIERQNAKSKL